MLDNLCYDHIRKRALVRGQETGWPVLAEWLVDSGVKNKPFASTASLQQDGEIRNT